MRWYLCFLFLIEKMVFRWIHFIFPLQITFPELHLFPEFLPSCATAPRCALMLRCSCLVGQSSPPASPEELEKTWKQLCVIPLPHQLSAQRLFFEWTWRQADSFCNSESSQANWVRLQRAQDTFTRCTGKYTPTFTLNISFSVEYCCIFRRHSKENTQKRAAILYNVWGSS